MPLSAGLQTTCDAKIDDLVTQLSTIQTTYNTAKGKYWQGISCPTTIPADGATVAATTTAKPTDQSEDWTNVNGVGQGITVDANLPIQLRVDTYNGPSGKGYVVIGTVVEATRTYRRAVNVGSETGRTQAWADVTPA